MIHRDYPGNRLLNHRWLPLALVLLVGLALRLALWNSLPRQGLISDEAEYLAAASWLAQGRGFTWHQGWLWTRAPLYPLFLSLHIRLFGLTLDPIFITQTGLSLVNVALVYLLALGKHEHSYRTAAVAALLAALYLPFATYPQMLLSETFYMTLLLTAFLTLKMWYTSLVHAPDLLQRVPLLLLALAGGIFGLAALTRGLTLGFLPLVALWVGRVAASGSAGARQMVRRAFTAMLLFTVVCSGTILPWSFYASKLYGGPVLVDTTGAFNLLLGSRTAYDGKRSDATPRNFVLAFLSTDDPDQRRELLNGSCLLERGDPLLSAALQRPASTITQADRQRLMTAEGLCLLRAAPAAFLLKSVRELVDLFQINYTGAERMSGGFALGRLPSWYTLALFLLDDTLYLLMLPLAIVGLGRQVAVGNRETPLAVLVGLWWLYNLFTAPLLFAINRFRIPLLIFACIYAARLFERRPRIAIPSTAALRRTARSPVLLTTALLAAGCFLAAFVSYIGPYPSSRAATQIALRERPAYLREQQLIHALGNSNTAAASTILEGGDIPTRTLELALPLLAGLEGEPELGLHLLPASQTISQTRNWRAAVVRGDLLRRMGDADGVRAAFTPTYVDEQNPVEWAWHWLSPVPTRTIDLAGNRDLGYIQGFYLGAGDPQAGGTFRWSTAEARLLFPGQGSAQPQHLCLRADGRGWPDDMALPHFTLLLDDTAAKTTDTTLYRSMHLRSGHSPPPTSAQPFATIQLQRSVETSCATLPATPPGADITVLIQSPVFVPDAADLLAQQGSQAGQLRLLGVRLDWAELRARDSGQ